jgi:hypothetical protein
MKEDTETERRGDTGMSDLGPRFPLWLSLRFNFRIASPCHRVSASPRLLFPGPFAALA